MSSEPSSSKRDGLMSGDVPKAKKRVSDALIQETEKAEEEDPIHRKGRIFSVNRLQALGPKLCKQVLRGKGSRQEETPPLMNKGSSGYAYILEIEKRIDNCCQMNILPCKTCLPSAINPLI